MDTSPAPEKFVSGEQSAGVKPSEHLQLTALGNPRAFLVCPRCNHQKPPHSTGKTWRHCWLQPRAIPALGRDRGTCAPSRNIPSATSQRTNPSWPAQNNFSSTGQKAPRGAQSWFGMWAGRQSPAQLSTTNPAQLLGDPCTFITLSVSNIRNSVSVQPQVEKPRGSEGTVKGQ